MQHKQLQRNVIYFPSTKMDTNMINELITWFSPVLESPGIYKESREILESPRI